MHAFNFYKDIKEVKQVDNTMSVLVPSQIKDEKYLLKIFASKLNFPDYFGENWDAFEECINDLSFVNEKNILILHEDLPFEHSQNDRRIYVNILFRAVNEWRNVFEAIQNTQHELLVYFPESCKHKIEKIVNEL